MGTSRVSAGGGEWAEGTTAKTVCGGVSLSGLSYKHRRVRKSASCICHMNFEAIGHLLLITKIQIAGDLATMIIV